MNNHYVSIESPLGPLSLAATEDSLKGLFFGALTISMWTPLLEEAAKQLNAYFEGKLKVFDLPLLLEGTSFQASVWQAIKQIPYGETWSYQKIAELIGHPSSWRAVANANGRNPLPIIVPCHRVIQKNGSQGGYSGGVAKKHVLLEIEKKFNLSCI